MNAPSAATAPAWHEGLDAETCRQISVAPRSQRLALLARTRGQDEVETLAHLGRRHGLELAAELTVDSEAVPLFSARIIHEFHCIPLRGPEGAGAALRLVTSWPPDDDMTDWLALFTHRPLQWQLAPADKVQKLILEHCGVGAGSLEDEPGEAMTRQRPESAEIEGDADAAVVRFVSDVIDQAIEESATDIHFEPREDRLQIRYRIDGLLVPVPVPANLLAFQDAIISRLKIMARLNISERRLPQDGRITFRSGEAALDIRISTYPTVYAESISLRLLNQRKQALSLTQLGMNTREQELVTRVLDIPHGIILVTGPTGSGKSTSLNAFLRQINSTELRILTIEDPIEYELPGANQAQVHPEIGLTFASALRHMLRQDPDVIMVGEIRDRETAEIAIQASLTGHLVLSTLHTNDAPGAITRLVDMGIEPFLVGSAVELIIAQRLVRKLCPSCARTTPAEPAQLAQAMSALGLATTDAGGVTALPVAVGCDRCRGTGYRGRVGLFEMLRLNEPLHALVVQRESARTLAKCAQQHGMRSLNQSGWEKIRAGLTTLDEVLRVITTTER